MYNTYNATIRELAASLLGGTALNYVGHRACVCGISAEERKERKHGELEEQARPKELAVGQERNRLHRATRNGAWLSAIPHCLNVMELYWEEFLDNLCLRYGLMP